MLPKAGRVLVNAVWSFLVAMLLMSSMGARAAEQFLPPEQAFQFAVRAADASHVEVSFTIAPGYYLYREQFKFAATGASLGPVALPAGKTKFDETFQKTVETYRDRFTVLVPVDKADKSFRLVTTSQGCADAGLCYPPMPSAATVSLVAFGGDGTAQVVALADVAGGTPTATGNGVSSVNTPSSASGLSAVDGTSGLNASRAGPTSSLDATAPSTRTAAPAPSPAAAALSPPGRWSIDAALQGGHLWIVVLAFFGAGVLLSLTPCVLPMLPIVSSIIVGQGANVSRSRGLALAASYSLGLALVYTALGVAAGLAGEGLAAALQNPLTLGLFAVGLVALSLSMFGVYNLRLPASFTGRVTAASNRLPAGRVASVAAMGGVSALIVSPCVAAPLAGALVYLSQTRNVVLGGTALFALAAGMSVPLLVVGASAGALLPKAGAWMDEIKRIFGFVLLGVALWTVQSVLPASLVLALWGALAIGAAVTVWAGGRDGVESIVVGANGRSTAPQARRVGRVLVAALLGITGLLQCIGAASGGTDPLQPLARFTRAGRDAGASTMPRFAMVRSVAELDTALRQANRPVMLDFYADWCVSCKEMERDTFTDATVQSKLASALLLKADVTENNADDKALLKRFGLFGPPGIIFFDARGSEIIGTRVIGFQNPERFNATLRSVGL